MICYRAWSNSGRWLSELSARFPERPVEARSTARSMRATEKPMSGAWSSRLVLKGGYGHDEHSTNYDFNGGEQKGSNYGRNGCFANKDQGAAQPSLRFNYPERFPLPR